VGGRGGIQARGKALGLKQTVTQQCTYTPPSLSPYGDCPTLAMLLPSPPFKKAQKTKLGPSSRASQGHRKLSNAQGYK